MVGELQKARIVFTPLFINLLVRAEQKSPKGDFCVNVYESVYHRKMTPAEVYAKYRIYRGLQKHQLRVAAVARFVAERSRGVASVETVTRVGLFHDMGNIIKADLPRFQEFLEPEGLVYWEGVKREFVGRYGPDEHVATAAICRDIGLSEDILSLIDNMRFSRTQWILEKGSIEQKICKYADMRVSPWGILPLRERLAEARARYQGHPMDKGETYTPELLARSADMCAEIEAWLVSKCDFVPEDITDTALASFVEQLKSCPLS